MELKRQCFFLTELQSSPVPGWHGGRLRVPVDYSPLDSGDGYTIYLSGIYLSVGRLPSSFYFPLLLLLLLFYLLLFFFLNTFFFPVFLPLPRWFVMSD